MDTTQTRRYRIFVAMVFCMTGFVTATRVAIIIFTALLIFSGLLRASEPTPMEDPEPKVIIGTELGYPPYSFADEHGDPSGYNTEQTEAIASVTGLNVEMRIGPWGEIRKALEAGEIDAIAGMFYSEERDKLVDFSPPFTIVHHAIFARKDSPAIESEEELSGKDLIVMRGDIMHDYVMKHGYSENPVLVDTIPHALRLLASGEHDYALIARLPGVYWAKELDLRNVVTAGPLMLPSKYCFAVREGNKELLARLTEGLAIIDESGRCKEICDKWLGPLESPAPAEYAGKPVKIGVLAKRGKERCLAKWGLTADYLTREIEGYSFEIVPLDFDEVHNAITYKEVDFVLANSSIYVEIEVNHGASRIATLKNFVLGKGYTNFAGTIFTRADRSDITTLDDLREKTFMAVDETSFGGWLMAWREFKDYGIDPRRDFADLQFGGTHDAVVCAVRDGKVDAGTVRSDTLDRMEAEGRFGLDEFRVLKLYDCPLGKDFPFVHSTRHYPEWPFASLEHTSHELAEHVAAALMKMDAGSPAAKAARSTGWTVPKNYQPVHECLKDLHVAPYEHYGEVTLADMWRQYWMWIVGLGIAVIAIIAVAIYVLRLNGRLRASIIEREKAKAKYKRLFKSSRDALMTLEPPTWRFTSSNEATVEMFHTGTVEKFTSLGPWDLSPEFQPDGRPSDEKAKEMIETAMRNGSNFFEWRHKRLDGEDFPATVLLTRIDEGDHAFLLANVRDVTEQKKVEEAVRQSEEKYRALFDGSSEGILVADTATRKFAYANRAICRMLGYTEEELMGMGVADIHPGEDLEHVVSEFEAQARGEKSLASDIPCLRKDGGTFYADVNSAVTEINGRNCNVGFFTDITERKQAEETLRESEAKYRRLSENSPAVVFQFLLTPEGEFTFPHVNETVMTIMGISAEEVMRDSSTLLGMMHPDDVEMFRDGVMESAEAIQPYHKTFRAMKDGEVMWVEARATPERRADGSVLWDGVFIDITDRKQAEETLRENEARLQSIFRAAPVGIGLVSNRILKEVNERICEMTGYSREELVEHNARVLYPTDEDYELVGREKYRQIAERGTGTIETRLQHKDGTVIDILLSSTALEPENLAAGVTFTVLDITERKRAEKEIRELARFPSENPNPVLRVSIDGTIIFANDSSRALLDVWGCKVGQALPDAFRQIALDVLASGVSGTVEVQCEGRTLSLLFASVPDANCVNIYGLDITERKRAEEEIQKEKSAAQRYLDIAGVMMIVLNPKGEVILCNKKGRAILGYEESEIIGRNWFETCLPGSIADETKGVFEQLMADQVASVEYYENPVVTSAGEHRIIAWHNTVLRNESSKITGVLSSGEDITEQKQAEEERDRLMLAIEQAAEIIMITDVEGLIQYVNPAFEYITGYTRDEAVGRNPRMLKSGEQDDAFYRNMWDTLTRGETWSGQFINMKKDGTFYTEEAVISLVRDTSGQTVNYVAVKRDITEEMKLEAQLRQAQKMEAIGQLTGGVAHDFNNLLQVIIGCTDIAMRRLDADNSAREPLTQVTKAGKRAAKLISQLLLFSRRQIMQPEFLDLNETIADLLKMLGRVIGEHINLQWYPGALGGTVNADRGMIEQALMNLCVNAHDAMPEGGELTIETHEMMIDEDYCATHSWAKQGRFSLLSVSDTGCGMDKETIEHIFEPFFTTKETGKGTGLGLSTVYGIIKQHNGMIHAYSEPGKGSTFKLYWPVSESMAGELEEVTEGPVVGGTETILLVEDDEGVRVLGQTILERAGYTVLTAGNGAEAVAFFKEHGDEIDMAILDVVMPEMGGRKAYEQMQILRPGFKALFASGYSVNAIHTNFVLDRGLTLIQKPYAREAILRAVRGMLDQPAS